MSKTYINVYGIPTFVDIGSSVRSGVKCEDAETEPERGDYI